MRPPSRRFRVLLSQSYQLFRDSLRFLGLVPCRRYCFVLEKRCDEVSEKGFSMLRRPTEMTVLHVPARHGGLARYTMTEEG
jgi:hypothetical protein